MAPVVRCALTALLIGTTLPLTACHGARVVHDRTPPAVTVADADPDKPAPPLKSASRRSKLSMSNARRARSTGWTFVDTPIGRGFFTPQGSRDGIACTPLHASVAYRHEEVLDVGLFYNVNPRLTVGLLGQRLERRRKARVDGQLIDPTDLSSFIPEVTLDERTTSLSFGPFAQLLLRRECGPMPAIYLGGYALEWGEITSASTTISRPTLVLDAASTVAKKGDRADRFRSIYIGASKRVPGFRPNRLVRDMRFYGGGGWGMRSGSRYTTAVTGSGDPRIRFVRRSITRHSVVGWLGTEARLPKDFYLYGEVFTGDECDFGWAAGLRWQSPFGVSFSIGIYDCTRPIQSRALDLVYLEGGVGSQPSLATGGSGGAGGGTATLGHLWGD